MAPAKKTAASAKRPTVKQIAFRVDSQLARRLKIASAVHGKTQLAIVAEAVEAHLAKLEKTRR